MKVTSAYTRLLVTDLKACLLFYKDVMEFPVNIEDEKSGYAEFQVGGMKLSLFRQQEMAEIIRTTDKPTEAECQDKVALIFTVHDVDQEYHRLLHKNINFVTEPMNNTDYRIKTVYFRDPDGNLIGLYQFLD
ncbi:VOC family protein [Gloeocapsopsis sp. IPPAS B-1203]|uniref:VOC family protein n=1 Tax=Gloeocapsopsis sp. IPPAS B-1203 TaxID=2049454 RepID=UPI000C1A0274|nr:VOC family protein [Gloeocapsopsis sp. IPPAS B-1203]PIG91272.1 bleomycin resistance protein [Gloeocapsopsis sp. IPPAS B-1203]